MREVERALVLRASRANALLVDSREACAIEAGELIEAGLRKGDVREIGECVLGFGEGEGDEKLEFVSARGGGGEEGEGEITMFKSVRVGLQDVAIACEVVRRVEGMGVGTKVEGFDA